MKIDYWQLAAIIGIIILVTVNWNAAQACVIDYSTDDTSEIKTTDEVEVVCDHIMELAMYHAQSQRREHYAKVFKNHCGDAFKSIFEE